MFRGVVRLAGTPPHATDLATLAVLSGTHMDDPLGEDSAETTGANGTQLLPDTATAYHRQFTHGRLMLEEVTHHRAPESPSRRRAYGSRLRDRLGHLPRKIFVSREVTAVFGVLGAAVVLLATATAVVEDGPLWKSVYLPLLDIFTMGDPATEESTARQALQLIAGSIGLAVLRSSWLPPGTPPRPSAPRRPTTYRMRARATTSSWSASARSARASWPTCAPPTTRSWSSSVIRRPGGGGPGARARCAPAT
ncbi:hypothetical protein ABT084_18970 [Streptomyces sp. NPDC002138]|uniref:hypothetical protein n=1 Tax=Streptomyces sp. NPDC002138 TaxID=3154410 RepID=UPI00331C7A07